MAMRVAPGMAGGVVRTSQVGVAADDADGISVAARTTTSAIASLIAGRVMLRVVDR